MNIEKAKSELREDKNLLLCSPETVQYVKTPIGKAIFRSRGRPSKSDEEKAKPTDKVVCKICGKTFVRSNRSRHNDTNHHKIYEKMSSTIRDLIK
jgi:hypothetical protein